MKLSNFFAILSLVLGFHLTAQAGTPGWHSGGPRPGFQQGWHYDYHHPAWWHNSVLFPAFSFAPQAPAFQWQCIAYDANQNPYSVSAASEDEATYDALYDCGGSDFENQCFLPQGYCEFKP